MSEGTMEMFGSFDGMIGSTQETPLMEPKSDLKTLTLLVQEDPKELEEKKLDAAPTRMRQTNLKHGDGSFVDNPAGHWTNRAEPASRPGAGAALWLRCRCILL